MPVAATYAHTNLIVRDFERMVAFYCNLFSCTPTMEAETLTGDWVADITGVPAARLRVLHLRLPGVGADGPTLEVIAYDDGVAAPGPRANRPGFGHIAFRVPDVAAARDAVLAAGGGTVGRVVSQDMGVRGRVTETYVTDPEGNIIELQCWSD